MAENKFYLTKEGLEKIKKEHQKLLEFKRSKVKGEIPNILHSEEPNPEYLTFQEDMTLLEARLAEYGNILQNAEIIKRPPREKQKEVGIGATVTLDMDGEIDEFTIVGTLEADPSQKKVSHDSPLGKGLLGAKLGDFVKIEASVVNHDCKILKIVYRLS